MGILGYTWKRKLTGLIIPSQKTIPGQELPGRTTKSLWNRYFQVFLRTIFCLMDKFVPLKYIWFGLQKHFTASSKEISFREFNEYFDNYSQKYRLINYRVSTG